MRNFVLPTFSLLFGVFLIGCVTAQEPSKEVVNKWLSDKVLLESNQFCKKSIDGASLYIKLRDKGVESGYLLDVDRDDDAPFSYIFSWGFQRSDGVFLVQKTPSEVMSKRYVKLDGILYAESIESFDIDFKVGDRIAITAIVHRYEPDEEVQKDLRSLVRNDDKSLIKICTIEI